MRVAVPPKYLKHFRPFRLALQALEQRWIGPAVTWILQRLHRLSDKQRRAVALILSLGLHALFICLLLIPLLSGSAGGGQGADAAGEGDSFGMDLVSIEDESPAVLMAKAVEAIELDAPEVLSEDVRPVEDGMVLDADQMAPLPEVAPSDAVGAAVQEQSMAGGTPGDGSGRSQGEDDLWNAIAPCWRRLADAKTQRVSLKVSFAGNGMLAKAAEVEKVVAGAAQSDGLRSASLAMQALAECGAYEMAAGRSDVVIDFIDP